MAKIQLELTPFSVPNDVTIKISSARDTFRIPQTIELCDLDEDILKQLCEEFVSNVYTQAKKRQHAKFNIIEEDPFKNGTWG